MHGTHHVMRNAAHELPVDLVSQEAQMTYVSIMYTYLLLCLQKKSRDGVHALLILRGSRVKLWRSGNDRAIYTCARRS